MLTGGAFNQLNNQAIKGVRILKLHDIVGIGSAPHQDHFSLPISECRRTAAGDSQWPKRG
jgi:hypothetical protein